MPPFEDKLVRTLRLRPTTRIQLAGEADRARRALEAARQLADLKARKRDIASRKKLLPGIAGPRRPWWVADPATMPLTVLKRAKPKAKPKTKRK